MDINIVGIIIVALFLLGTAFHLRKRKTLIITSYVKPMLKISLLIIAVIFISMAHLIRGETVDYLIALSAIGFMISSIYSQGISEEGVCYFTGKTFILSTAPWNSIKKATLSEGEILGIEFSGKTARFNQAYRGKDTEKILGILEEHNLDTEKEK
ncbi:hypothetical protein [Isachenkonia alkalipeptolytica]|uniref:DUF5673 domain-containing protein n=1 Tax=Isachenkonia alkalipeptolytica TaxID=2565777 RepID=A0AA43XJU7_9CLOT|nr:hypothetical protein [Isachenkonia alkalipeptolytica]NBG88240.1 hypothetical protein [Isachenkonia alkalipeptolytica]